ncbi:MAG: very short patch repair endonuclease [Deltaproteobacteria bacterium]|nr:very short patch repair endonuclease [Deltaproteobacteria bacterium]
MPLSRSEQMSRIRGKDTTPERRLRSALWAAGLRYRLHARTPIGRPDVVFAGRRVAVFIDGCFWHGCPYHYVRPRSRAGFWAAKLASNVARDRRQTLALEELGWSVVRVWEHEVRDDLPVAVARVQAAVDGCPGVREAWRVVRVEVVDIGTDQERRYLEALRDAAMTRTEEGRRITEKRRLPQP